MLNLMNTDELFAEESLIPATFTYGARGIAKGLDPGSTRKDLARGQTVSIPMWLVPDLVRRALCTITMPEVYNERHRRKMNAGAECLSLRNKAQYFYDVGIKYVGLLRVLI